MNHETTEFARWRWAPRRCSSPIDAVAIFGYRAGPRASTVAGIVLAVMLGISGAVLLVHWWAS